MSYIDEEDPPDDPPEHQGEDPCEDCGAMPGAEHADDCSEVLWREEQQKLQVQSLKRRERDRRQVLQAWKRHAAH